MNGDTSTRRPRFVNINDMRQASVGQGGQAGMNGQGYAVSRDAQDGPSRPKPILKNANIPVPGQQNSSGSSNSNSSHSFSESSNSCNNCPTIVDILASKGIKFDPKTIMEESVTLPLTEEKLRSMRIKKDNLDLVTDIKLVFKIPAVVYDTSDTSIFKKLLFSWSKWLGNCIIKKSTLDIGAKTFVLEPDVNFLRFDLHADPGKECILEQLWGNKPELTTQSLITLKELQKWFSGNANSADVCSSKLGGVNDYVLKAGDTVILSLPFGGLFTERNPFLLFANEVDLILNLETRAMEDYSNLSRAMLQKIKDSKVGKIDMNLIVDGLVFRDPSRRAEMLKWKHDFKIEDYHVQPFPLLLEKMQVNNVPIATKVPMNASTAYFFTKLSQYRGGYFLVYEPYDWETARYRAAMNLIKSKFAFACTGYLELKSKAGTAMMSGVGKSQTTDYLNMPSLPYAGNGQQGLGQPFYGGFDSQYGSTGNGSGLGAGCSPSYAGMIGTEGSNYGNMNSAMTGNYGTFGNIDRLLDFQTTQQQYVQQSRPKPSCKIPTNSCNASNNTSNISNTQDDYDWFNPVISDIAYKFRMNDDTRDFFSKSGMLIGILKSGIKLLSLEDNPFGFDHADLGQKVDGIVTIEAVSEDGDIFDIEIKPGDVIQNNLSMKDLSTPICSYKVDKRSPIIKDLDVRVSQPFNYGLYINSEKNPIDTVKNNYYQKGELELPSIIFDHCNQLSDKFTKCSSQPIGVFAFGSPTEPTQSGYAGNGSYDAHGYRAGYGYNSDKRDPNQKDLTMELKLAKDYVLGNMKSSNNDSILIVTNQFQDLSFLNGKGTLTQ